MRVNVHLGVDTYGGLPLDSDLLPNHPLHFRSE